MTEKVKDFMGADHDRLDAIFQEYLRALPKDKAGALRFFAGFKVGLQRHIVWEEEILFPLFEERTGMKEAGPTAVMRQEHRQIKGFLEEIHDKFGEKNPAAGEAEEGLLEVLKAHNEKEENILYPWIDQSVSEKERAEAFARMRALPPEKYNKCCE
ncbi:MAG TPA: hemerythrin domain-containing protein [Candidatus Diapherotrites archaeon]|uniref:Hemerythrin domain-containing protein n=1 Tax=Candidatus Iainarchaeum sp. TaxID=3101447 RepID=A0A7J4JHF6_9ARCH|nr:hemerythrin domain-containing protein [Candidatus Diapherotrites archaeon]HIH15835.1 hemerythrin domain-containing protein [Candidatus Diapherotrites archaeon]